MTFPAAQIAMLINGRVEGDPQVAVVSFGKIEEAKEGELSFLANPKYEEYLYRTQASVIIINDNFVLKQPVNATLIRVPDAYSAFATLLSKYQEMRTQQLNGIQEPAYISKTAIIGNNVFVGAFSYVGENAYIGNDVKIFPGVYIGNNARINDNSMLANFPLPI